MKAVVGAEEVGAWVEVLESEAEAGVLAVRDSDSLRLPHPRLLMFSLR